MSEFIEVISKQSLAQVDELIKKLQIATGEVKDFNDVSKQIKVPSQATEQINNVAKATDRVNKSQKEAQKTAKQLQRERIQELRLQKRREQAFDKYEKQLKREQRRLQRTTGLYNQVQKRVNTLSREYNDLAIKKRLNGKLTAQEVRQLDYLEVQLNKYQGALKKVDSNIGKYQRNVGNYASGWNGLGNSINQLTREAPAFANSVQTGFMALSNNIPILTDEINRLIQTNKALQAQGKPTQSVFRQIMKSLLSFQTLMSVGITLSVLYAKKIGEIAKSLFSTSNQAKKAENAQREYNKAVSEGMASVKVEITTLNSLISIVQDETQSREKRNEAVAILQEKYPKYLENLSLENANSKEIAESVRAITEALKEKAKFQAAEQLVTEKAQELFKKQLDAELEYEKRRNLINQAVSNTLGLDMSNLENFTDAQLKLVRKRFGNALADAESQRRDAIGKAEDDYSNFASFISNIIGESDDLFNLFGKSTATTTNTDEAKEQGRKIAKAIKEGVENENLEELLGDLVTGGAEIDLGVGAAIAQSELEKYNETLKLSAELMKQLADESKKAFQKDLIIGELSGLLGMLNMNVGVLTSTYETLASESSTAFEKQIALANGVGEVVNGIGQTIFQNEQIRLQNQLALNSEYYNNQIEQASGNAEQQELLRREQASKERQIRQKQAENEKQSALFEIAINTAAAIVKALPNIPLSVAIGAIGAAKAALVASRPVPQFKHGREGGPETWAILGDGYKNEPIIDKKGNLKAISPNKPTMMHLDKGDSVLPDMNRLNDEIINKTMLLNVQATAKQMTEQNQNKGLERMLQVQSSNLERSILKSLKKAKFVNVNNTKVDLGFYAKLNKYKGK